MNGSISTGMRGWPRLVANRQRDLKRAVGLKLFGAVIKDTPVDTGRLRANWQTSLSAPDKDTSSTLAAEATDKMVAVTSVASVEKPLLMCNSLPYARRIEYDGWSHTKAPQGMMNRNVLRFRTILARQLGILKKGGLL